MYKIQNPRIARNIYLFVYVRYREVLAYICLEMATFTRNVLHTRTHVHYKQVKVQYVKVSSVHRQPVVGIYNPVLLYYSSSIRIPYHYDGNFTRATLIAPI